LKNNIPQHLEKLFGVPVRSEPQLIQKLWSGYGELSRYFLSSKERPSIIVKHIHFPSQPKHPRGWNTNRSHVRKVKSYEVELEWYRIWSDKTNRNCKIPFCFAIEAEEEEQLLVLEDLDAAGYHLRRSSLTVIQAKVVLKWLAHFHGNFMSYDPRKLWKEGSYWHLETRPDEWKAMDHSWLKSNAAELDKRLKDCQFQTIIHGDAKVANFCFKEDLSAVAAVDFQYVGGGCGMRDVAYFLGSCLLELECEKHEDELLAYYFKILKREATNIDVDALEKEWRSMYAIAWADFTRFLLGWMPTHQKVNGYSLAMVERAKKLL
tara:strand:- start:1045 stop:2004 length:960 start_codon:yes stop_codon:yes gene_type:complete